MNAKNPEFLVTNHRIQPDGTTAQYELRSIDGEFILTGTSNGDELRRVLCPVAEGIDQALGQAPEILRIGTGITSITTGKGVNHHEFIGLLIVDDPEAPEPDPEQWNDEARELAEEMDIDVDKWHGARGQIHDIRTPEHYTLMARWLRIDGERQFVVTGPGFAAVGVFHEESDWNRAGSTRDMLTWSFYRESGAPVTWDGSATLGWCGSKLWSFSRRGDIEPTEFVFPAPPVELVAQELAGWILHLDWEMPYLASVIGLPGLTDEDREALANDSSWTEGDDVSSYLPKEVNEAVVAELCARHDEIRQAADGLRNPESERGQLIYAWVRQIVHGPAQSGSWDHVHAAMLGSVEPPADDQRAPTSQERWAQEMERAAAVIREATGQPERIAAVDIPDGVVDAVSAAYDTPTPTQLRDAITRQERDATLIDGAHNLLGTKPGERHVMRKVKELVEQEPDNHEREADLWSAYWLIRDWDAMGGDDGHEGHLAQLRKLLTHAEKQERAATEKEWPKAWPMGLMPVWLEYGGTVEAARAWASAGWPADHVLTSERLTDTWNPEFEERLTLTTPENRPRNP